MLLAPIASSLVLPILLLLQMAVQRAQRHAVTPAELTSSHPARPIQTCQPLYLRSAKSTQHRSKLSAHKQSPSQILSRKKGAFLRRVRSFSYYDVAAKKWTTGSSKFTISVGDSVESLPLQGALSLRGT